MPVFDSMTLSRRMALTYALVLALTLAVLYSGYSALNAVVAQAPQFKTLAGDAQSSMVLFAVLAVLLGVFSAFRQVQSISSPLADAIHIAETVAAGDLSHDFENTRGGEFGRLLDAMGTMEDTLTDLVTRIKESTEPLTTSSGDIAHASANLLQHTEMQTHALDSTAASMEELTSTVRENAQRAQSASTLAVSASGIAQRGGEVVGEVVSTMQAITDSSRKVVDIIAVIEGISFQTNILALNAAVEAARAGEQGRGFAVVATEVRNLAQRSAAAAKQIKELINDSMTKVAAGDAQVKLTFATMQDIVDSIKNVNEIIGTISVASAEQSNSIEQINVVISQLESNTQKNAAQVEEVAASAELLKDQASKLVEVTNQFTIDEAPTQHSKVERPKNKKTVLSHSNEVVKTPKLKKPNTDAKHFNSREEVVSPSREETILNDKNAWKEF